MPKFNKNKRNQKQKQPKEKRSKRLNKSPQMVSSGVGLSHCAMKYALAIADPWNIDARGACIPRHPSRPSQKVTSFTRFTVTIGTNGLGFVNVMPCLANDERIAYASTSTFAATTFSSVTSTTTGVSSYLMTNLPYPQSNFVSTGATISPNTAGRIVSFGVSWQYTGTVSNMGGLAYALVHPDHNNLNDDAAGIPNYAETQIIRNDNKRHWLGASSLDDVECSYSEGHTSNGAVRVKGGTVYPYSNGEFHNTVDGNSVGGAPMAVWFTGAAGNTFEVELIGHYEFVGKATQAVLSPSHSDSVGFEVVQNAAARLPSMSQTNPTAPRKSLMSQALQTVGRELAPVVRLGAKQLIGTAARGLAGAAMGFIAGGPTGAVYGSALGVQSGALMLTNG